MEQRPAEREPLSHSARVRRHPLVPRVPEAEALEQHADPLPPLRHAVQPAEEVEVLEPGQLPVDERLVREKADASAVDLDLERARGRRRQAREHAQQRRLAGPVRAGHEQESVPREVEIDAREDPPAPVALLQAPRADHAATSSATKAMKTMLITPFTVKNAAFRRRRSPGRTIACS